MKIVLVYVCPLHVGTQFASYGWRFFKSYCANLPGMEHDTVIVCNGCSPDNELYALFKLLPNCSLFQRDNSGFDIGAFQHVSKSIPCDMMVFFGSSAYLNREGWLTRMYQTWNQNKNCQFGSMANRGHIAVGVWPHIRTTGFWMNPDLMAAYPIVVNKPEMRHPFEHGQSCFTEWLKSKGVKSYVVTWNGQYEWKDWDSDPNGFHRGNQSSLLSGDRMSEPPYYPHG